MGKGVAFSSILFMLCLFYFTLLVRSVPMFFDVRKYGAVGNRRTDCTKAFLSSWNDACSWNGNAQIVVPGGTYLVNQLEFRGPCKGPIGFINSGIIKAHGVQPNFWIRFQYVGQLDIFGGGSFDGQGPNSWPRRIGVIGHDVNPPLLILDFINNSRIENVKFIGNKGSHIRLFRCKNIVMNHLTILAPKDSLNTDGINIAYSTQIQVLDSFIATGDDCISILPGSQDINISGISCGPGHGISIGSMGGSPNEPPIKRIHVSNCNFTNTLNGVRIKTWATNNPGIASDITFENIYIHNANNPIIIDQNYCPSGHCLKGDSHVQIKNVKFMDVRGDSLSRVAVNFKCSKYNPCQVETRNIDLKYDGSGGRSTSSCVNVRGNASGCENPPSCLP